MQTNQLIRNWVLMLIVVVSSLFVISCHSGSNGNLNSPEEIATVTLDSINGNIYDKATGVALKPDIILSFSTEVDLNSINANTIKLVSQKGEELALIINKENNKLIMITPQDSLLNNQVYKIEVKQVKTKFNQTINQKFSFMTADYDTTQVSLLSPTEDKINLNPLIKLKFNHEVVGVTEKNISLMDEELTQIAISTIESGDNNTYFFSPKAQLKKNSKYVLTLSNKIVDKTGKRLIEKQFALLTGKYSKPQAVLVAPLNYEDKASLMPLIKLKFNEEVAFVDFNSISLYSDKKLSLKEKLSDFQQIDKTTYTFKPSSMLRSNTNYYLVLKSTIIDRYNNHLDAVTFRFKTDVLPQLVGQLDAIKSNTEVKGLAFDSNNNLYLVGNTNKDLNQPSQDLTLGDPSYFLASFNQQGGINFICQVGVKDGSTVSTAVSVGNHDGIYITGFTTKAIRPLA